MKTKGTISFLVGVGFSVAAFAQSTWTGGGSDAYWTSAANWGGTAPIAGDALFFGGQSAAG